MSQWQEVSEEGKTFYVNEELGNIVKITETTFIAMYPKIIKLGPFSSLEEAKEALSPENQKKLLLHLDHYNHSLTEK